MIPFVCFRQNVMGPPTQKRTMLGIMKALLPMPSSLTLTDLETPEPDACEVRVRIAACGICGSDVHGYTGSTGRRIPPLVMGHEAAGIIDAVGKNVRELVGQRVAIDSTVFCGECEFCNNGQENLCTHRQVLGVSCDATADRAVSLNMQLFLRGASIHCQTRWVLLPHHCLSTYHRIAGSPLGNASPATRSAVVIGAGTIGLAIIVALKSYGVQRSCS